MTVMDEWQIVPKAPTLDMVQAGIDEAARGGYGENIYAAMIAAAPEPPHLNMTREEAQTFQNWKGMDGACAFHLIERHANGWGDVALMMGAWLAANRETPNVGIQAGPAA